MRQALTGSAYLSPHGDLSVNFASFLRLLRPSTSAGPEAKLRQTDGRPEASTEIGCRSRRTFSRWAGRP